jgi:hypothetical protein
MPFVCNKCGKEFTTKQRLKTHYDKKIPCIVEDVNKINNTVNDEQIKLEESVSIDNHKQIENDNKFTCQYCDKKFKIKITRDRHQNNCKQNKSQISKTIDNNIDTSKSQPKIVKTKEEEEMDKSIDEIEDKISVIKSQYRLIVELQDYIIKMTEEHGKKISKFRKKLDRSYSKVRLLNGIVNNYDAMIDAIRNSKEAKEHKLNREIFRKKIEEMDFSKMRVEFTPEVMENYKKWRAEREANGEIFDDVFSGDDIRSNRIV